jgi:glycosyltransferase involved in cell wall biosynthesis
MVFVGEGPLREELELETESLGVSNSVMFLGHLSYDEMPSVYRGADVLLLPSRAEGLPRTVLEAMASGVVPVTSDLPQLRDVVKGGGETVRVGDVAGFSRAVGGILEDVLQTDGASKDTSSLLEGYAWGDTVERTTALLVDKGLM